jgi:hypothetical protein
MNLALPPNYHDLDDQLTSPTMSKDDLYYLANGFWFEHVLKFCSTLNDLTILSPENIKIHDNNGDLQQNDSVEQLTIQDNFAFSQKNSTVLLNISKCLPALKFLTFINCDNDEQQPKQEGRFLLHG